jgi:hypothetical protein
MYTVSMGHECACFKRSEYESEKTFENQKDAYNYANVLVELMNEEFCATHQFFPQITSDNDFIIGVTENPNKAGSCSTSSDPTGCSTGSCGC